MGGKQRLSREFFARDGITVARELLGKILVHETKLGVVRGVITETESYMGEEDKGSHTYGGRRTDRTEPMYHQGGTSYVYLIYGMYSCMNIAAMTEGIPQAVLLRKVEPADEQSREIMEQLRFERAQKRHDAEAVAAGQKEAGTDEAQERQRQLITIRKHLADGPGKLCIAMGITRKDNDIDMVESPSFYVTEGLQIANEQIKAGKRIGIDYAEEAADYPWRFYL